MGAVEMAGILKEGIEGREVRPTAKPPHRTCLEVAVVQVHGGDVGIPGMQHHRGPGGKPWMPFRLGALLENGRRQFLAMNFGEVHAALFKNPAFTHHTGTATTTFGTIPALLLKTADTIELFQAGTDLVLQAHHQSAGALARVGWRSLTSRHSWGRRATTQYSALHTLQQGTDHG